MSETTKALMAPTWPNAPEMDGNPNHYVKVLSSFCLLPFHAGTRTFREMLSALNVTRYSKFSSVFPAEILWNLKNEIFTGIKIKYLSCPKLSPNVQMLRYNERPHSRVSNLIGCLKKSQITREEKQETEEFSPSLNLACSWTVTANVFIHCFVTLACKQTS